MATYKIYSDGELMDTVETHEEVKLVVANLPNDLPVTVEMVQEFTLDVNYSLIPIE